MPKTKHSVATRRKKGRLLKKAKGYWGDRSKQFQQAKRTLMRAMAYAYADRKVRKREFRRLWITRINAACREEKLSYSKLVAGLKKAGIDLNRKMLAEMALKDAASFKKIVSLAQKA